MRNRPGGRAPAAIRTLCTVAVLVIEVDQAHAQSESVRVVPTVRSQVTLTDNVNLEPDDSRDSALIFEVVPGVDINVRRARSELRGSVRAPVIIQTAGGRQGTRVFPQVALAGRIEPVEDFFYVEGTASVTQQYFSPFGARSPSLANNVDNRYTSQSYRLSPVIEGVAGPLLRYRFRNDNIWTVVGDGPGASSNAYSNRLAATLDRAPTPVGWRAEYFRDQVDFRREISETNQVARVLALWRPDPQLELALIAGYEELQLAQETQDQVIYGALARWRPTPRTSLNANWQHRVGGSSYQFGFANRTPLTVWNFDISRSITNFPQQLLDFPVGSSVPALLDQLFFARIPDAAERELAVARFMQEQGLGTVLAEPFTLFGTQFRFVQQVRASVGLLGVRNSVFFNLYQVKTSPVRRSPVDEFVDLPADQSTTQRGAGATWTRRLSSATSFLLAADVVRVESDDVAGRHTDQGFIRANVTTTLSPRTSAFAGVRLQKLRSDVRGDAREAAVYAGVSHSFR